MLKLKKIVLGMLYLGFASEAFAQGCAMCLASAMGQNAKAAGAMNYGILVLLIPSFLFIVGVLFFTFLRRP
jgi:hypothetical protein